MICSVQMNNILLRNRGRGCARTGSTRWLRQLQPPHTAPRKVLQLLRYKMMLNPAVHHRVTNTMTIEPWRLSQTEAAVPEPKAVVDPCLRIEHPDPQQQNAARRDQKRRDGGVCANLLPQRSVRARPPGEALPRAGTLECEHKCSAQPP